MQHIKVYLHVQLQNYTKLYDTNFQTSTAIGSGTPQNVLHFSLSILYVFKEVPLLRYISDSLFLWQVRSTLARSGTDGALAAGVPCLWSGADALGPCRTSTPAGVHG